MAAASMSWAVAAPTAWLSSSKQQAEGLRSLLLPTGVRVVGGLKCSSTRACAASFDEAGLGKSFDEAASGKSSNGFVDMGVLPIQFENGQDPPTVVFAPNRRIVASELSSSSIALNSMHKTIVTPFLMVQFLCRELDVIILCLIDLITVIQKKNAYLAVCSFLIWICAICIFEYPELSALKKSALFWDIWVFFLMSRLISG